MLDYWQIKPILTINLKGYILSLDHCIARILLIFEKRH